MIGGVLRILTVMGLIVWAGLIAFNVADPPSLRYVAVVALICLAFVIGPGADVYERSR